MTGVKSLICRLIMAGMLASNKEQWVRIAPVLFIPQANKKRKP
jgi:hypothetical protein